MNDDDAARTLAAAGALLIGISLATGLVLAAAMTGKLDADGPTIVGAHLASMMGAFWLFALAWSLPMLSYGPQTKMRLAWLVIATNYANWATTLGKAFFKVHGLEPGGSTANTVVFGILTVAVVIPSFVGVGMWLAGFRRKTA